MTVEIVKIQRPLETNDASRPWLIYTPGQSRRQFLPEAVIPSAVKRAMGDDHKGYFKAQWSSVVGWAVGLRVKDQPW